MLKASEEKCPRTMVAKSHAAHGKFIKGMLQGLLKDFQAKFNDL